MISAFDTVDEESLAPRARARITSIRRRLIEVAPDAEFALAQGDDPAGLYLTVVSDTEDGFDLLERVSDELTDALIEDGIALYVVPIHRSPPAVSTRDAIDRLLAAAR